MHRQFLTLITMLVAGLIAQTPRAAPASLRVDYFHSGNNKMEMFSLDQVVIEPQPFSGNLRQPVDSTLRGKYSAEVVDAKTSAILWSRSYSSIYGEWETTDEALNMNRTFHESVRLPAQQKPFDFVLKKRDSANDFQEIWRLRIDPADYLVHRESAAYADRVVAIEHNGDSTMKVDLLMLGDGYTADQHDEFIGKAHELTEALFRTSPFRERRSDFNVWALAPASAESGVSRPSTATYRDSPIGATYDAFRSERYVLTTNNKAMRRIASSVPYDFVEILTNTDTYGGGGIYGLYATAAANSEWAEYLFIHEFGHHFAGLADEYYTSSVSYRPPAEISEPYEPNVTALLDADNLKWKTLVADGTPVPTPWPKDAFEKHSLAYQARRAQMRADNVPESEMNKLFRDNQTIVDGMFSEVPHDDAIGAFEGANYQAGGYYRSQMNCLMFTRTTIFCQVCADAIEQVIDEYSRAPEK